MCVFSVCVYVCVRERACTCLVCVCVCVGGCERESVCVFSVCLVYVGKCVPGAQNHS